MSTDQICAYCEHHACHHLNGSGQCHAASHPTEHCPCPRFVANTDTETHEVTAQVLAEADRRKSVLEVAVESERALCGCGALPEHTVEVHVMHDPKPSPQHIPTDLVPPSHYVGPSQSRATKISIIVFHCADQRIQAARAGRHEDAEEWRELIKRIDEL